MIRKGCLIALMLLVAVIGVLVAIVLSTPASSERFALQASPSTLAMLRMVPTDAEEITVIPAAAGLLRDLRDHPVTKDWIGDWQSRNSGRMLPLLLGDADVVAWRRGDESGYVANPDGLRRTLARLWLAAGRRTEEIRVSDGLLVVGRGSTQPTPPADLPEFLDLAGTLEGHLFFLQRESSESRYPPIERPAVTSASIMETDIILSSRSRSSGAMPVQSLPIVAYPRNAMLATAAAASPEWLDRLDRVLPIKLEGLLDRGAMLALYRVDEKTLVPRVEGIVMLPEGDDPEQLRSVLDSVVPRINLGGLGTVTESRRVIRGIEVTRREGFGYALDFATHQGSVLIAFDKSSMERYLSDTLERLDLPPDRTVWFVRVRPTMLSSAVDQLQDRKELALLVPDVYDSIRELDRWLEYFHGVSSIVMARLGEEGYDVVTTTISAPK